MIVRSLIVKSDFTWMVHVLGHPVDPSHIPGFDNTPFLNPTLTTTLLQQLEKLRNCVGNPDAKMLELIGKETEKSPIFVTKVRCSCLPRWDLYVK